MTACVDVVRIDLDAPALNSADALAVLSADECARATRFAFDEHRRRWRAGRVALRLLLARAAGVQPRDIELAYAEHGKPYWPSQRASIHFNLSHTGSTGLFAATTLAPLGIDIETVRPLPDMDDVARRVFSAAEQRQYFLASGTRRKQMFFRGWTRKEAVLKARGTGLSTPLRAFDVSLDAGATRVLACRDGWDDGKPWTLLDLPAGDGFAAAIAVRTRSAVEFSVRDFSLA